jgi:hypothetical protein
VVARAPTTIGNGTDLPNFGRCRSSIHEALYPFATVGPVVNLARGQDQLFAKMFGRRNVLTG